MSKLEFNIVEIPEGESHRELELGEDEIDLSPYEFQGGEIQLKFYRALQFIRVNFHVETDVELVCDRSLEDYTQPIEADYEILFKVDVREEKADENGAVKSFNFSSNTLSIGDEVRDTLMLNIPMQKLHPRFLDEDGVPMDFETKKFGNVEKSDEQDQIDPRWEALKKLKD